MIWPFMLCLIENFLIGLFYLCLSFESLDRLRGIEIILAPIGGESLRFMSLESN